MTADLALAATERDGTRVVVAEVVARKALRSGAGWGIVFGLYVATQALAYATSYKTAAARKVLIREFSNNVGISALVGPARQIGTVPGYTAWKCLTVLSIIGSVWAILISTKLIRGEEEAGRWELFLVGQTTRRQAALEALAGLTVGLLALWCTTTVLTIGVGRSSKVDIAAGAGAFFSLSVVSGALLFLGVGALCAQITSTRRQAAGFASTLLGASYALRMIADSTTTLGWLRWMTPLGWVENLQPLTSPRPLALVPLGFCAILSGGAAIYVAGRRDLGAGVMPDHSSVGRVRDLPATPFGLAVFLEKTTLLGWAAAISAYGLLLGGIAKSGGKIITSSPTLGRVFRRLGISGADAYLSVALLIMAVALAFVAAGQVSATRREESGGQLDNLLVRPYSRTRWFVQRTALGAIVVTLGGLIAGGATWLGATLDRAHVGLGSLLDAGLNVAVPAFVLLGVGMLAIALVPRYVSVVTYGLLLWFFLIEIVSSVTKVNHWILDLSAFHQMAAAPATSVNWSTNALMIGLGLGAAAAGLSVFRRRDIKGD